MNSPQPSAKTRTFHIIVMVTEGPPPNESHPEPPQEPPVEVLSDRHKQHLADIAGAQFYAKEVLGQ